MRSVGGAHQRLATARADLNYATVDFVPGDCSPWKERLFILFGVTAWDCKAAVVAVVGLKRSHM